MKIENPPSKIFNESWIYSRLNVEPKTIETANIGKWLIFVDLLRLDAIWNKIKDADQNGELGISAKCGTAKIRSHAIESNKRVICIYTYDWTDYDDVYRVENHLRKIGINQTLFYKLDNDTIGGKYQYKGDTAISIYISKSKQNNENITLSELHNVGFSKTQLLNRLGIVTIEDLIKFDNRGKIVNQGISNETIEKLKLSAIAKIDNLIFKVNDVNIFGVGLLEENIIYFDIETDLSSSYKTKKIWFIGVLHQGNYNSFFAETWDDENKILTEFLEHIKSIDNPKLYSYSGTSFDRNVVYESLKRNELDSNFFLKIPHFDICSIIKKNYIFPCNSYGLKEIGKYLNYEFKNSSLDGYEVARQYELSQLLERKIPDSIFKYVEDDVRSIEYILHEILRNKNLKILDISISD